MTPDQGDRSEMTRLALVIQNARIRHAKAVDTLPDGEVADMDELGRTLDQAIACAVMGDQGGQPMPADRSETVRPARRPHRVGDWSIWPLSADKIRREEFGWEVTIWVRAPIALPGLPLASSIGGFTMTREDAEREVRQTLDAYGLTGTAAWAR